MFLALEKNCIDNLSKFHVISPSVTNHSIPITKSQHPRGISIKSEVNLVLSIVQENLVTLEETVSLVSSTTMTFRGCTRDTLQPSFLVTSMSKKL